jgi:hypothetical protein
MAKAVIFFANQQILNCRTKLMQQTQSENEFTALYVAHRNSRDFLQISLTKMRAHKKLEGITVGSQDYFKIRAEKENL